MEPAQIIAVSVQIFGIIGKDDATPAIGEEELARPGCVQACRSDWGHRQAQPETYLRRRGGGGLGSYLRAGHVASRSKSPEHLGRVGRN